MGNTTDIWIKCFAVIFGLLSLILPWLFYPEIIEVNFLGIVVTSTGVEYPMIIEFAFFGVLYLIGLIIS